VNITTGIHLKNAAGLSHEVGPDLSKGTFYKWKAKFGGMEISDARKLKALEVENARLKKLVADLSLDNAMLKDVNAKKW
jgi:putative transposase